MKDFPIFSTEYGVASLFLKEIPYRQEAYIRIRDVQPGKLPELLADCAGFCTMAGAERVYAAGHEDLDRYPLQGSVYTMQGAAWVDPEKRLHLFPVTEATVARWRQICNERMRHVDFSATQTSGDEKEILESGRAYFVHDHGALRGIGWVKEQELLLIASVEKGMGERVAHTLMSLLEGQTMTLEVASTNTPAIRWYEKLGFLTTGEKVRWYRVR